MDVNEVRWQGHLEQRRACGKLPWMFILIAVGGHEMHAIHRAVHRHFTFRATAHRADFFTLGWAVAHGLSFFANRTEHAILREPQYKAPTKRQRLGFILI